MLEPYQEFEEQVKEIVGIVKEADATVRQQVKVLEETERMGKETEIWDILDKRIKQFKLGDLIPFTDFYQAQTPEQKHIN